MNIFEISKYNASNIDKKAVSDSIQKKDSKLLGVCQDFEAIFVKQMLDSMKKTINKSGLVDGGMAEDIFQDMLYDKYSKIISKNANLGLADMMYNQLSSNIDK